MESVGAQAQAQVLQELHDMGFQELEDTLTDEK
jgi:hypothetical protein